MSIRLADPARSRIVLIGTPVHRYADERLPDVPAVANNIADLAAVFTDPELGGFDPDRCVATSAAIGLDELGEVLTDAAEHAKDLLLIYYAGHGLLDRRGQLHLALAGTRPDRLGFTALPYETLRTVCLDSDAALKVVILDSCFSGRAIGQSLAGDDQQVLGQLEVAGTYTLTSAPANRTALILPGERHTAFTGRLLQLLRDGDPQSGPVLSIGEIYRQLRLRLQTEGLPLPQQRGTATADLLGLVRNHRPAPPAPAELPEENGPSLEPPAPVTSATRRIFIAGLVGTASAGVASAAAWATFSHNSGHAPDPKSSAPARPSSSNSPSPSISRPSGTPSTPISGTSSTTVTVPIPTWHDGPVFGQLSGELQVAAFSPDGTVLATAANENSLRLWDVDSRKEVADLDISGGLNPPSSLMFSPNGLYLAGGTRVVGQLVIWNARTHKRVSTYNADAGSYIGIGGFSPNIKLVAVDVSDTSSYGSTKVIDVSSGNVVRTFSGGFLAFGLDSETVLTVAAGTVTTWNVISGVAVATFQFDSQGPYGNGTISPDLKILAVTRDVTGPGYQYKDTRIWRFGTQKPLTTIPVDGFLAFAAGNTKLFIADPLGGLTTVWDVVGQKRDDIIPASARAVSADGTTIVTSFGGGQQGVPGTLQFWKLSA